MMIKNGLTLKIFNRHLGHFAKCALTRRDKVRYTFYTAMLPTAFVHDNKNAKIAIF